MVCCSWLQKSTNTGVSPTFQELYRIGPCIGTGVFGDTRICFPKDNSEALVVKRLGNPRTRHFQYGSNILQLADVLRQSLHACHIIQFVDFFEEKDLTYLVMNRYTGGTLLAYLTMETRLSEAKAWYLSTQILLALFTLHSNNIVHRNVSAESFLFSDIPGESPILLTGFGYATRLPSSYQENLCELYGKPSYLAPELIQQSYRESVDVWVNLWSMFRRLAFCSTCRMIFHW